MGWRSAPSPSCVFWCCASSRSIPTIQSFIISEHMIVSLLWIFRLLKRQMISAAEKSNSEFWLLSWIFLFCNNWSQLWDWALKNFLCSWLSREVSSVFSCWLAEPGSYESTQCFLKWTLGSALLCLTIINNKLKNSMNQRSQLLKQS